MKGTCIVSDLIEEVLKVRGRQN